MEVEDGAREINQKIAASKKALFKMLFLLSAGKRVAIGAVAELKVIDEIHSAQKRWS